MTVLAPAEVAAPAPAPTSLCVVCRRNPADLECLDCYLAADRQYERSLDD